MIGIYEDGFIEFLKSHLGEESVKIKSKNIIARCPWCEMDRDKTHYHLYISTEAPIFHCFHSSCHKKSGVVPEIIKALTGIDSSEKYINPELVNYRNKIVKDEITTKKLYIPELKEDDFKLKTLYMKKRLGFNINLKSIKGLIFNIKEFLDKNKYIIQSNESIGRLSDYLHANFVGFITDHNCIIIFRNIDSVSSFRHFKYKIQDQDFSDYYKINGLNYLSNHVILAEGIFDILSEYSLNTLYLRDKIKFYMAGLSSNYQSLIRNIVINEDIYRLDVSILSDRDVDLDYYKNLKKNNDHIINSLNIYYNCGGKDFDDFPVIPEKFIIN